MCDTVHATQVFDPVQYCSKYKYSLFTVYTKVFNLVQGDSLIFWGSLIRGFVTLKIQKGNTKYLLQ